MRISSLTVLYLREGVHGPLDLIAVDPLDGVEGVLHQLGAPAHKRVITATAKSITVNAKA